MRKRSHKEQQAIWEREHRAPETLLQMDSPDPSSGVVKFYKWLEVNGLVQDEMTGIEFACGKGRNVQGLANLGVEMTGIDFSPTAIAEAETRSRSFQISNTHFLVHDAIRPWPFKSNGFDIAIDCFGTTDIESPKGRKFTATEVGRVLKANGHLLVYTLSTGDQYYLENVLISPANSELHAFFDPVSGKFEKSFTREELISLYSNLELLVEERIEKTPTYNGKKYRARHHWMVFKKPPS